MGSSKFATPFFKKSPLLGAYTSGADAMVTISDAPHYAKLQSDIGAAVSKATTEPVDKCDQLDERLATNKIGIDAYNRSKKNCVEKEKKDYLESPEGEKAMFDQKVRNIGEESSKIASKTLQGYEGEFDPVKTFRLEKERKSKKEQDATSNAGKLIFK